MIRLDANRTELGVRVVSFRKQFSMIVIKAGGGEGIHYESVCDEIAELARAGRQPVLVHGGSHLTNQLQEALGYPPQFLTSPDGFVSRYTDRRTMEIFMMAYCGQTNKSIVESLQSRGVNAVGLSGLDGRMWVGKQKAAIRAVEKGRQRIIRDNLTGTVTEVNTELLRSLVFGGMVPVLCPPAMTKSGQAINVDGDRAAAITAAQLDANELVILSNVPGLMRDIHDPESLISTVRRDEIDDITARYARGRMKIKLLAAASALDAGVNRVIIADARPEHCISRALEGEGTVLTTESVAS